jgi:hypothetical protein
LQQPPGGTESQNAAVSPDPAVFVAARGARDPHRPLGRFRSAAQAGIARIAREHHTGTVGLHDLNCPAHCVQLGFIAQFPAAADDSVWMRRPAVRAVVMSYQFQPEHAGQWRHVDLSLVLVAADDINWIAGANVYATIGRTSGRTRSRAGAATRLWTA